MLLGLVSQGGDEVSSGVERSMEECGYRTGLTGSAVAGIEERGSDRVGDLSADVT